MYTSLAADDATNCAVTDKAIENVYDVNVSVSGWN